MVWRKRWTEKERVRAALFAGGTPLAEIREAVGGGRTLQAVAKALPRIGAGSVSRGTESMVALSRRSGYCPETLHWAAKQIGFEPPKTSPAGRYMIDEEWSDRMLSFLAKGFWCRKLRLQACSVCGLSDRPHSRNGACDPCRSRMVRLLRRYGWPVGLAELRANLESCRRFILPCCLIYLEQALSRIQGGMFPRPEDLHMVRMAIVVSWI